VREGGREGGKELLNNMESVDRKREKEGLEQSRAREREREDEKKKTKQARNTYTKKQ